MLFAWDGVTYVDYPLYLLCSIGKDRTSTGVLQLASAKGKCMESSVCCKLQWTLGTHETLAADRAYGAQNRPASWERRL